jgi:DUF4097 and DUF4098 domain-containing protein YvlB
MTQQSTVAPAQTPPAPPPHRGRTTIRIIALVLGVVALVSGTSSVIGVFFTRQSTTNTLITAPVQRLSVTTSTGSVVIRAAAAGEPTRVISKSRSAFHKAGHSVTVKDGELTVSGACLGRFFLADSCSMSFEIVVPAGSIVEANSSTGSVTVSGRMASTLASTDTGNVRVVGGGGPLRLQTDTGHVTGSQLTSGTVSAQTSTGWVSLGFATAPNRVTARVDTGDVRIRVPDDGTAYRVQADTDTGQQSVLVPVASNSPRVITANTDTGDVQVEPQP